MSVESVIIIVAALAIGAMAKGMTGLGLPPIAIAILSVFVGVEQAIVVTTIPVAFANFQVVWVLRRRLRELPVMWSALVAAAAGVGVGTWVLASLDDRILTIILVVWVAVFLLSVFLDLTPKLEGRSARLFSPVLAVGAGISQGATGFSGPLIATWGYAWGFVKETYVLGVSVLFCSISGMHVIGVAIAGLYDQERIIQGVLAILPVMICVPLGLRLAKKISPRMFKVVIVAVIGAMEVKLVWGLLGGA